jgi:hypothetical protein
MKLIDENLLMKYMNENSQIKPIGKNKQLKIHQCWQLGKVPLSLIIGIHILGLEELCYDNIPY